MRFVILGGGPAGYAAASAAAAIGADVTLVEDVGLGGNATLWDAIPSKTLLSTAGVRATVVRAEAIGLAFQHGTPQVDLLRTVAHARYVAAHQSRSIRDRLEGTATNLVSGRARITEPGTAAGDRRHGSSARCPTTGSCSRPAPRRGSRRSPRSTTRACSRRATCSSCVACPSTWSWSEPAPPAASTPSSSCSCGVRVTLLSARPQVLPAEDRDIAEIVEEAFLARGCELQFDARVTDVEHREDGVSVTTSDGRCFDGSHAVVCMGMRPASADLGLERARDRDATTAEP